MSSIGENGGCGGENRSINYSGLKSRKKKTPVCTCPNCSANGGNKMKNSKGQLVHVCHHSECRRVFVRAGNLVKHLEWHSDKKNFLCQYCNRGFTRSHNLKAHLKIHMNVMLDAQLIHPDPFYYSGTVKKENNTQLHHLNYVPRELNATSSYSFSELSAVEASIFKTEYFVQEEILPTASYQVLESYAITDRLPEVKTESFDISDLNIDSTTSFEPIQHATQPLLTSLLCKKEEQFSLFDGPDSSFNSSAHHTQSYVPLVKHENISNDQFPQMSVSPPLSSPITSIQNINASMSDTVASNSALDTAQINAQPVIQAPPLELNTSFVSSDISESCCENSKTAESPVLDTQEYQTNDLVSLPAKQPLNGSPIVDEIPEPESEAPKNSESTTGECSNCYVDDKNDTILPEKKHHIFPIPDCGQSYTQERLSNAHLKWHSDKKSFFCAHCDQGFALKLQLCLHLKKHKNPKSCKSEEQRESLKDEAKYVCHFSYCRKVFGYAHTMRRHLALHSESKEFVCKSCDKGFTRKDHLVSHLQRIHKYPKIKKRSISKSRSGEKSTTADVKSEYVCHIPGCGKSFGYEHTLRRHLELHSGRKNIVCAHCDKGFTRKDHLLSHVQRIHMNPNSKSKI